MSADNRTPHTDALATLGMVIGPQEKRDAIHLGVEPVISGEMLYPGEHIGLLKGVAVRAVGPCGEHVCKPIGIVDPFLTSPVTKNERFWLIVYPRQITSLRHVWEHPFFPDSHETSHVS